MIPAILVLNAGSSSLKFSVFEAASHHRLANGLAQELGSARAIFHMDSTDGIRERAIPHASMLDAGGEIFDTLQRNFPFVAIGHRVVHGGEIFTQSCEINAEALKHIRHCSKLAPLHNPPAADLIELAISRFPGIPQVAVFDTAFHQSLPPRAFHYAIPHEFYQKHGIRRYGFHGTSHSFVTAQAASRMGRPFNEFNAISVHLGNGCSACAIRNGLSVDTTMGFTPLEGLVMGSRSGDLDPAILSFLADCENLSHSEIHHILNTRSGLLGISGLSSDMRTLEAAELAGNDRARLAIDVFCHRLAKAILSMAASLDRIDSLVFTGGIGENSASVRARTLSQLKVLGLRCDPRLNACHGHDSNGRISSPASAILAFAIPTQEELAIAIETARKLSLPQA